MREPLKFVPQPSHTCAPALSDSEDPELPSPKKKSGKSQLSGKEETPFLLSASHPAPLPQSKRKKVSPRSRRETDAKTHTPHPRAFQSIPTPWKFSPALWSLHGRIHCLRLSMALGTDSKEQVH